VSETIEIIVEPAGKGRYHAVLDGRRLCTAKVPLCAAARILQAEGMAADTMLALRHAGSPIRAFSGRLSWLAARTVDKNLRWQLWPAFPSAGTEPGAPSREKSYQGSSGKEAGLGAP
jgi:hypothetical protein